MKLDETTRTHYINIGKMTLEQVVADGEEYLPKLLAEVGGQMHLYGCPGFDEFRAAGREMLKLGQPVTALIFTVDSYHLAPGYGYGLGGKVVESFIPGTLGERFAKGDKKVSEALHITAMTLTEGFIVTLLYRREGTTLHWGEPMTGEIVSDDELGGRYPEAMRQIITQSQRFN